MKAWVAILGVLALLAVLVIWRRAPTAPVRQPSIVVVRHALEPPEHPTPVQRAARWEELPPSHRPAALSGLPDQLERFAKEQPAEIALRFEGMHCEQPPCLFSFSYQPAQIANTSYGTEQALRAALKGELRARSGLGQSVATSAESRAGRTRIWYWHPPPHDPEDPELSRALSEAAHARIEAARRSP